MSALPLQDSFLVKSCVSAGTAADVGTVYRSLVLTTCTSSFVTALAWPLNSCREKTLTSVSNWPDLHAEDHQLWYKEGIWDPESKHQTGCFSFDHWQGLCTTPRLVKPWGIWGKTFGGNFLNYGVCHNVIAHFPKWNSSSRVYILLLGEINGALQMCACKWSEQDF